MILLPGELGASLCEKAQGMVESPQLYFEVPEHILEFIYSVHKGTLTPFLRNRSHKAERKNMMIYSSSGLVTMSANHIEYMYVVLIRYSYWGGLC